MTNKLLSKLKSEVSYEDYKKTQQGVSNVFLSYIYIYTTSTSPTLNYIYHSWVYYTIITRWIYCNYVLDVIVLVSSTMF